MNRVHLSAIQPLRHRNHDLIVDTSRLNRGEYAWTWSSPASPLHLAGISPNKIDRYDKANYISDGNGLLVSRRDPRFVLADINKITRQNVLAALALDKCLVFRDHQNNRSIYLTGPHTYALWGWAEAVDRKELAPSNNTLIHIDDHPDLTRGKFQYAPYDGYNPGLTIDTVNRIIEKEVMVHPDPLGISTFIRPAIEYKLISKVLWIYGQNGTAEAAYWYSRNKAIIDRDFSTPDPEGIRDNRQIYAENLERIKPHYFATTYNFPANFLPIELQSVRSDSVPEKAIDAKGSNILDFDIDVADDTATVRDLFLEHLARTNPRCVTIAVSPEFSDNHIDKVMALLEILKRNATIPDKRS